MNIAILLIEANRKQIEEFVKVVTDQKKREWIRYVLVCDEETQETGMIMADKLGEVAGEVKVHPMTIGNKSIDKKFMTMFAHYMSTIYFLYPGETLLMDGSGIPDKPAWIETLRSKHREFEKYFTGTFDRDAQSAIPIGPIIFDAPAKVMKIFRFAISPDWRGRGRWTFGRSCNNIPADKSVFKLVDIPELTKPVVATSKP